MSKILIISATKGANFQLAQKISNILTLDNEVLTLEDYPMPMYVPNSNNVIESKIISDLCGKFIECNGLIFCAPEYNGGSPPILTNAITWMSLKTDNWRDAFRNKVVLIATHSGGAGQNFLTTFGLQLQFMGSVVFPRNITVNSSKKFNEKSVNKILSDFSIMLK